MEQKKKFLYQKEWNQFKKDIKVKRFWQIQGLNLLTGMEKIGTWFFLISTYTIFVGLTIFGIHHNLSTKQLSYLEMSFLLLAFVVSFSIHFMNSKRKANQSEPVFVALILTCIDILGVLYPILTFFLNPSVSEETINILFQVSGQSFILFLVAFSLKKLSINLIKRHYYKGKEQLKWINWSILEERTKTKTYHSSMNLMTHEKDNFEEGREKVTVRLHYSWLTLSFERTSELLFEKSRHLQSLFNGKGIEVVNKNALVVPTVKTPKREGWEK